MDPAKKVALDAMVSDRMFEIICQSAQPMLTVGLNSLSNSGIFPPGSNSARIDLTTNPNHVRVMGDSVSIYLPYYGEQQIGGGSYNSRDIGIEFQGIPKELEITESDKTKGYDMKLVFKNEGELYTMTTQLFPNLNTSINVNSTRRTPIGYHGRTSQFEKDKESK